MNPSEDGVVEPDISQLSLCRVAIPVDVLEDADHGKCRGPGLPFMPCSDSVHYPASSIANMGHMLLGRLPIGALSM